MATVWRNAQAPHRSSLKQASRENLEVCQEGGSRDQGNSLSPSCQPQRLCLQPSLLDGVCRAPGGF